MKIVNNPAKETWNELCRRPQMNLESLEGSVKNILDRVKTSGDAALRELTLQFDAIKLDDLKVTEDEIKEATANVSSKLKNAIELAARNIETFHAAQKREPVKVETAPGV